MATLSGTFATRREAEMTVERLVQEFGVDRANVQITPEGGTNSAGEKRAGSDNGADQPGQEDRDDAALTGGIVVTADVADGQADEARSAFAEFGAENSQ